MAYFCVSAAPVEAQTIYQYRDSSGAVVLTDKPPGGVKAEPIISDEPRAAVQSGERTGMADSVPRPDTVKAEEAIRERDRKFDEVIKTVEARDAEREREKRKRLQEAERLEVQAREPMPSTRENRQRQYELLQEAQKLRQAE